MLPTTPIIVHDIQMLALNLRLLFHHYLEEDNKISENLVNGRLYIKWYDVEDTCMKANPKVMEDCQDATSCLVKLQVLLSRSITLFEIQIL